MDVPWIEQYQKNIDEAMATIQREFDYSGSTFGYRRVNERLNKLWRSAYNLLLDKYNNKDLTVEEVLRTLPDYIIKDQFLKKLMERRSPRGLEISEINKGNRAKQTSHSLGSKSLAQRNYEAEQKGLNDIEIWKLNIKAAYPKDERVDKAVNWIDSEKAKNMAQQENMNHTALIQFAITEFIGRSSKKSRTLGTTGSLLSKKTTHRMNVGNFCMDKGKDAMTEAEVQDKVNEAVERAMARQNEAMARQTEAMARQNEEFIARKNEEFMARQMAFFQQYNSAMLAQNRNLRLPEFPTMFNNDAAQNIYTPEASSSRAAAPTTQLPTTQETTTPLQTTPQEEHTTSRAERSIIFTKEALRKVVGTKKKKKSEKKKLN